MTVAIKVTAYLFIALLMFFVVGCAKDHLDPHIRAHLEKPSWIIGEDDKYTLQKYLTGRSVSARLSQAKRQSADDLAQTINDQLMATHTNGQRDNNDAATEEKFDVSKLLDEKTRNYLLQRIRISEIWQDPATYAYHVLSTIDREKLGDEMLQEIKRMDEQIARIIKKASQEQDVLQRVAFANLAIDKQQQRDSLLASVKMINPAKSIVASQWNTKKIRKQISAWLNEVKIMPIAQHKQFNLMAAMKDGVTSAGMTVHLGAKPDYILKGSFSQGQIKWKDGVYSLKGNLQLELLDGQWKGQVRGDANWPIEVSALERDQLPAQLAKAIKQAHQKKLRQTLLAIEE